MGPFVSQDKPTSWSLANKIFKMFNGFQIFFWKLLLKSSNIYCFYNILCSLANQFQTFDCLCAVHICASYAEFIQNTELTIKYNSWTDSTSNSDANMFKAKIARFEQIAWMEWFKTQNDASNSTFEISIEFWIAKVNNHKICNG